MHQVDELFLLIALLSSLELAIQDVDLDFRTTEAKESPFTRFPGDKGAPARVIRHEVVGILLTARQNTAALLELAIFLDFEHLLTKLAVVLVVFRVIRNPTVDVVLVLSLVTAEPCDGVEVIRSHSHTKEPDLVLP